MIDYSKFKDPEFIKTCTFIDDKNRLNFVVPKILRFINAPDTEENRDVVCQVLQEVLKKLYPDLPLFTTQKKNYSKN